MRYTAARYIEQRVKYPIGGAGDIIEINESQIGRHKHHRGRLPNEVWVFGCMVRGSTPPQLFLDTVKKRDRLTLTSIIKRKVHPQSHIISDGWKAYGCLTELGYTHDVVNHSECFVSATNNTVHTQNIENLW